MATKQPVPAGKGNLPAKAHDYSNYEGQGFEGQTRDDLSIPFINILQPLSPQLENIPNAKPGQLFNTVTLELYPKGVLFVPAATQHVYVEWVPRDQGGGMVGIHAVNSDVVQAAKRDGEFGRYKTAAGNDLTETFYMPGVVCDEAGNPVTMAMLAFTSTKIKVYKQINTRLNTFMLERPGGKGKVRPPLFAHLLRITGSALIKGSKGSYYNLAITSAGASLAESLLAPTDARFLAAKECQELFAQGVLQGNYGDAAQEEDAGEGNY